MSSLERDLVDRPGIRIAIIGWLVFLFVFGARCALVDQHGSPLPFWDEWDAEGYTLGPAMASGSLEVKELASAHNEHRILFTRVQSLALLALTGTWEPRVQMLVNAVWMAVAATGLAMVVLRRMQASVGAWIAAFIALVFAAPHSWQNTLWGFQSQNAFGLLAGIGVLALATGNRAGAMAAIAGTAVGMAGLFTTAAGLLAPLACVLFSAAALAFDHRNRRRDTWVLGAGLAVFALGMTLRVHVPGHEWLQAKSVGVFAQVLLHSLAWPGIQMMALSVVLWAPVALLGWQWVRRRVQRSPAVDFALVLGLWTILHAAGIAWARGQGMADQLPLSRYLDGLIPGAVANALALAILASGAKGHLRLLPWAWIAAFALGLAHQTYSNFSTHLPLKDASSRAQLTLIGAYIESADATVLENRTLLEIGHAEPSAIRRVLDQQAHRRWHGTALQPPLRPTATEADLQRVTLPASGHWEIEYVGVAKGDAPAAGLRLVRAGDSSAEVLVRPKFTGWGVRAWCRLEAGGYTVRIDVTPHAEVAETVVPALAFRISNPVRALAERILSTGQWLMMIAAAGAMGLAVDCRVRTWRHRLGRGQSSAAWGLSTT